MEKKLPEGDALILGGDITLINCLDPDSPHYHDGRQLRERTMAFFDRCGRSFGRVFYIIGNHEAYNYNLTWAPAVIRKTFPKVTLLDDSVIDLGSEVILVGGTLWTDMRQGKAAFAVGRAMNDFRCITVHDPKTHHERRFTPEDAVVRFKKTKALIARTAKKHKDKIIVVATHHAPDVRAINPEHVDDRYGINHGYYTDLSGFIAEHRNIKWWTCGHTHIQTSFNVAQCTVISNARGYVRREYSADTFTPECWFNPLDGTLRKPGAFRRARVPA